MRHFMKKLIAILFLSLISLTHLSGKLSAWDTGYELAIDCEEGETENKEGKKEAKEFIETAGKKLLSLSTLTNRYRRHLTLIFPQPVLDQQTPPPNSSC